MSVRANVTTILVLIVLVSGTASQNLANALGRADFGITRKVEERRVTLR